VALRVAEVWRQKQLEYTFRLTAMERYEDFAQVTRKALVYGLASIGQELGRAEQDALMAAYNELEPFPDVEPALHRLRAADYATIVFSNGSPAMLDAIMDRARLRSYFAGFISVDEVRAYKPSPKTYRRVAERLGRPLSEVRLISANPFDVIGAQSAGMRAAWIDRTGGNLFDALGTRPDLVVGSLTGLADALTAGGTEAQ
jgi:2-haloacid dehalogenase